MQRRSILSIAALSVLAPWPALALPAVPKAERLELVNAHTGERFSGVFRNADGPIDSAMKELSFFLRDFHCGQETEMDVRVLDFLAAVLNGVGATRATVLSAYRTKATNEMLARTTFGVAEHSQHIYGRAIDLYLPARLKEAMEQARALKRGGVGWYPNSHFMHLDCGPVRNWTLTGGGLGRLLLDGKASKYFPEPIVVSSNGEFVGRHSGRPLAPTDRLALHDLVQKALNSLHRH